MTHRLSRRRALTGGALGLTSLAGCTDRFADEPPPIDVEGSTLLEIASVDGPAPLDAFPLTVTDEYVDAGIDRVDSLLASIPDDLDAKIPNEAVRRYVDRERESAREGLTYVRDASTNLAALRPLRRARESAAHAAGTVAAAVGNRTRADALDEVDALETRVREAAAFERIGEEPIPSLVVYERVEEELRVAALAVERLRTGAIADGYAEARAVGELDERLETGAARLDQAQHLGDRHADGLDDPRSFDDEFREATTTLHDDLADRVADLPERSRTVAEDLFDAPVEETPRRRVGEVLVREIRSTFEHASESREADRFAKVLVDLYRVEILLGALDRIRAIVADGGLDRPDDGSAVRTARADAVAALESGRADAAHPALVDSGLEYAYWRIRNADEQAEDDASYLPEPTAVEMIALYAIATAQARSVPDATDRLVALLT
ncbi:hypothetical protein [Halovivax cerinus]|uniref:Uncharacterized protein n=1 Tax=Halovivax cerinus TaxID=1487865 RepID=A0ABD5NLM5_9EURY|nr:hypothetical protein [Halovivax cerinus]